MAEASLEDRWAVRELIERYSDALTRRAWDEMGATFHEDARWTVPAPFNLDYSTRAGIQEGIRGQVLPYEFLVQMTHSIVVQVNGDKATATTVTQELARMSDPQKAGILLYGTYNDEIERRNGRWGFVRRLFLPVFVGTDWFPGNVVIGDLTAFKAANG